MTAVGDQLAAWVDRRIAAAVTRSRAVTFGEVLSVGPPAVVRFAGDTTGVPVDLMRSGLLLSEGDTVVLLRVGADWIVDGVVD